MLLNHLHNYEIVKLNAQNPNLTNTIIIFVLLCIILIFISRDKKIFILDRSQTQQLKGLAILFIILGHLWVHVTQSKVSFVFSGDGVTLFFLLSGFGLTVSYKSKIPNFKKYVTKRITRVMIPYWIATIIIFILDYAFLKRIYSPNNIALTFLGVNINETTQYIDYVRWFISILLLWYALFFFIFLINVRKIIIIVLFTIAALLYIFDYYITKFGWYQIYAFPVGCLLGLYYDFIYKTYNRHIRLFTALSLFTIVLMLIFKAYLKQEIVGLIPSISFRFVNEIASILLCFSVIFIGAYLGVKRFASRFLYHTGNISYELFLLHGAFLVKYNPVISNGSVTMLSIQFILFAICIIFVSTLFRICTKRLT